MIRIQLPNKHSSLTTWLLYSSTRAPRYHTSEINILFETFQPNRTPYNLNHIIRLYIEIYHLQTVPLTIVPLSIVPIAIQQRTSNDFVKIWSRDAAYFFSPSSRLFQLEFYKQPSVNLDTIDDFYRDKALLEVRTIDNRLLADLICMECLSVIFHYHYTRRTMSKCLKNLLRRPKADKRFPWRERKRSRSSLMSIRVLSKNVIDWRRKSGSIYHERLLQSGWCNDVCLTLEVGICCKDVSEVMIISIYVSLTFVK